MDNPALPTGLHWAPEVLGIHPNQKAPKTAAPSQVLHPPSDALGPFDLHRHGAPARFVGSSARSDPANRFTFGPAHRLRGDGSWSVRSVLRFAWKSARTGRCLHVEMGGALQLSGSTFRECSLERHQQPQQALRGSFL